MSIKCIIVDDEPLARKLLIDFCEKVPFIELLGDFSSGLQAMSFLRDNPVDFLFLDIKMPDISGIELIKVIDPKPKIIFTTAFAEYAVDGFELDAMDYLLKPFDFPRFLKAVNKVSDQLQDKQIEKLKASKNQRDDFLFVKDGRSLVKVHFNEVLYIKGMKDYVTFHCPDKKVMSLMNMKDLEKDLPGEQFLRIHQSYIINIDGITSINNDKVNIAGEFLPVSQTYKQTFKKFLENYLG